MLAEKLPKLSNHLRSHEFDPQLFSLNWFLCIFVDTLPVKTYLHIWDAFLFEGTKVWKASSNWIVLLNRACDLTLPSRSVGFNVGPRYEEFPFLFQGHVPVCNRHFQIFWRRFTQTVGLHVNIPHFERWISWPQGHTKVNSGRKNFKITRLLHWYNRNLLCTLPSALSSNNLKELYEITLQKFSIDNRKLNPPTFLHYFDNRQNMLVVETDNTWINARWFYYYYNIYISLIIGQAFTMFGLFLVW